MKLKKTAKRVAAAGIAAVLAVGMTGCGKEEDKNV